MINNKQIKEAKPGKLKTDTPGLYVNVFSSTANGKPGPLQRKWRYKYRIKTSLNQYTYRHRVIGDWVETNNDPSKNQFTIAGVVARAEEIREAGKQGIDLLAREPVATIPKPLKDKIRALFGWSSGMMLRCIGLPCSIDEIFPSNETTSLIPESNSRLIT